MRNWEFTDRAAIIIIILLLFLGSLTPVIKALTYEESVGLYFKKIGEYIPRLKDKHFMMAEVDCVGYYSYLRSLIIDHDLDFENDFTLFDRPDTAKKKTKIGLTCNVWTVGPAILWFPGFLVAHAISLFLNSHGIPVPINGISFIYDFFIVMSAMGYGLVGILFIYFFLRFFYSAFISFLSLVFLFFASSLIFYQLHEPAMSHILTVFAVSTFIYFWYKKWLKKTYRDWILLGILGGLIILIRPQDVFFIVFPVLAEGLIQRINSKKLDFSDFFGPALLFVTAGIVFIPQMLAWKILYGSFITIPQGERFMYWFNPEIIQMLFSTNHGLITYTPISTFALIGLFLFKKDDRKQLILFGVFLAIFLCELYINSAAADWWAGWAFGARRFLSCSIMFAWGLANFLERTGKNKQVFYGIIGIFTFLVIFNLLFYFQWVYGLIPRAGNLTFNQYFTDKILVSKVWLKLLAVEAHIFRDFWLY